ncbi:MAG: hypothetical protein N0C86_12145 [Candidatus Thiodiazotropha taylori]|nr:hypothetical protein [Candidatus Thiodiazotropha taylori]MCW4326738.1 hypothetical protein [Candidatus Thiodiazotropha taylori]
MGIVRVGMVRVGMAQDQVPEVPVQAGRAVQVVLDLLGKVPVLVPVVPAQGDRVPALAPEEREAAV